jgi:NhaA family Na+:H+ antiporter
MGRRDLLVAGLIAGTGFTVALFVAGEAFSDPLIKEAAKMGAMLSIVAAVAGMLLARLIGVRVRK